MSDRSDTQITVTATTFKAKCLELFKKLDEGTLSRITVTRRDKPVAVIEPPPPPAFKGSAWGFMRGSLEIAPGVDLTEPMLEREPDDPFIGKKKKNDDAAA